ncbi:hypothetical protein [Exiguobacterium acetylicum]|uniref:HNH endonuclease 5 domain-containing protein n=1 Tax=Exiguobacterium acetylicum TaxID=41170 RepID=A0ABX8GDV1_EXIAC|nr:hypothetical protein [Exiguobacterium acetylicum]QWB31825.1 hypothetical protein KKI46_16975 [Exiguobacterium acetylicum]
MKNDNLIPQSSKNVNLQPCGLCKEEAELQLSHRMPKAVGNIIKKNSFSKKFRSVKNPEKSVQDLDKDYFLCEDCEGRFSPKEGLFMQKVLQPFRNTRSKEVEYDSWLNYFITSVSWRTIYDDAQDREVTLGNGFSESQFQMIQSSEIAMRKFLLDKSSSMKNIENHLIFLDETLSLGNAQSIKYSQYCNAAFGYLKGNVKSNNLYIFHNLAGVLILTIIKGNRSDNYRNTYVKSNGGKFSKPQRVNNIDLETELLSYLPQQFKASRNKLSSKTIARLENAIKKNPEGFLKSSSSIGYRDKYNSIHDK